MDWFVEPLRKYAVFSGRARRGEYWTFVLVVYGAYVALAGLGVSAESPALVVAAFLVIVGSLLPAVAVTVRRLHDTDRSGWWFLIGFVPFVGTVVMLVFLCTESEPGENRFGSCPKVIPAHL
ncbi:DUF805 domain-containing protein [Streptomyces sp. NPDC005538]|uniref:DUF805 domain-containing protein n=1 Tax=unclassified Streptomyces TaxID=2593676 RepID=UPI0033B42EBA